MRIRDMYERGRLHWRTRTVVLWVVVAYLAVLYVALRWGGGTPDNIAPSAD
jgi:hypothetical protein